MAPNDPHAFHAGLPATTASVAPPSLYPALPGGDPGLGKPPGMGATPDPMALWKAFQRRWLLATSLACVASVLAAGLAYRFIPQSKFVARSVLKVSIQNPRILFGDGGGQHDFQVYQKNQVATIKGRPFLRLVLADTVVSDLPTFRDIVAKGDEPLEWLENELKVDFPMGAEYATISLAGDRPEDLATLVNAVTDHYVRTVRDKEFKDRSKRLQQLESLFEDKHKELESKQKQINELANDAGSDDRPTLILQQQIAMETMSRTRSELIAIQAELRRSRTDLSLAQQAGTMPLGDGEIPDAAVLEALENDPGYRKYLADYEAAKGRAGEAARMIRKPNDPTLVAAKNRAESTKKALAKYQAKAIDDIERRIRAGGGVGGAADPATLLANKITVLEEHERSLNKEIEELSKQTRQTSKAAVALRGMDTEVQSLTKITNRVEDEKEILKVELMAQPRVELVDKATVPRKRDESKRIKMTAGAGVVAFAFVLGGISFWEFRHRRINSIDEVVQGLGMRLVGSLPATPDRAKRRGLSLRRSGMSVEEQWQSLLVESVDAARTYLMHLSRVDSVRVVMVTSAVSGEGKTSLAGHLAASLARAGRRTLLMDCDLRNPAVHRVFDLPREPGVCELLRGEIDLDAAICPTPTQARELDILTGGQLDERSIQGLAAEGLAPIFQALRSRYDFIIVDSAPVLPVVDTLLISQSVDAVIFAILREVSRVPKVHAAYERLQTLGVRILGAIVNGTEWDHHGGDYTYGKYRYLSRAAVEEARA